MKKLKSLFCVLFSLLIAASSVPFAFSQNTGSFDNAFVNGDSEGNYNDIYYSVDSESGCVFASDNLYTYRDYYTDYAVGKLAVTNGNIYVSVGSLIRQVDIKTKRDVVLTESESEITSFSYWNGRLYYLSSGDVVSVDMRGDDAEDVITGKEISSFWFDEDGIISYMTDEELVYSLNLETGEESSKVNVRSSFGSIPVYTTVDPKDGTSPCSLSITDLRTKFPDGKYWNHVGMTSNNEDGYTSSPCPSHSSTATCNCFSKWSSWQCMGFAYKCAWDTTGSNAHYWNSYTNKSALDSVKVGDVIRYNNDGHTVFVIAVSGSNVTIVEANWGGRCIINWDRTISISTLKSSFTWLRTTSTIVTPGGGGTGEDPVINYTLTLDANGGSCTTSSLQVQSGQPYGTLPDPQYTGYNFDGWFTQKSGGTQVTSSTICSSNTTVYAHWTEITYTVSYDANAGGDTVKNLPETQIKKYHSSLLLDISINPKRDNYEFKSWNTDKDGNGTTYTASSRTYKNNEDMVLYAIWEGVEYSLKFDANEGNCDTSSKKVRYGSAFGALPTPTRTDSDFQGWYTSRDGGTRVTESTIMNSKGMTVYAHWTKKQYTVTYDSNGGGSVPSTQTKTYGISIVLSSTTPTRTGFDFVSYNTSPDGSGKKYMPSDTYSVDESVVLYVIWDRNKYPVNYNSNGGTGSVPSTYKYYDIPLAVESNVPVKTGCDFVEWNTKADGSGTGYPVGSYYSGNNAVTLYAIWDVAKYKITYNANGGPKAPNQQTKIYQQSITLDSTVPLRTGYDFVNWNTKADGTGKTYNPGDVYNTDAHLTLYAQWNIHKYPITYNANGGSSAPDSQLKLFDIDLTLTSAEPKKTGYKFVSWNTSSDGTGTSYPSGGVYKENTAVSLYAQWEPCKYTITFYPMGGTCDTETKVVTYDSTYGTLPAVSKAGYTFSGWYTSSAGGTLISSGDKVSITSDKVLYAGFNPITYKVTFNSNGGNCSTSSKDVKYNTEYGALPTASRAGYTFTGWFTSSDGGFQVTSKSVMKSIGDQTVYAGWLPVRYAVTLDTTGGNLDTQTVFVSYGCAYGALPTPAKKGCTFIGWYTSPEGGTKVTADTICKTSAAHTLYARYRINSYKISFNGLTDTIAVTYGQKVGTMPVSSKTGYKFCGWFTEDDVMITEDTFFSFDEDITLTAKFIKNSSTLMNAIFVADGKIVEEVTINDDYTIEEPAVPEKKGYTGKWESYSLSSGRAVINAVYTPNRYKLSWVTPNSTIVEYYYCGEVLNVPVSISSDNLAVSSSNSVIPETMPGEDTTVVLSVMPIFYCAEFICEGKSVACVPYNEETQSITEPEVPSKAGYSGKWEQYSLSSGGVKIFAVYTPVTYQMVFEADGVKVSSVDYTVETDTIVTPPVPKKTGYTGKWESYSFPAGGCTVKAVYTPNTYTVTFVGNGVFAGSVNYKYGDKSVSEPTVPSKTGYTGKWPSYTLGASNQTVNAVYSLVTYYATFVADGVTIGVVPFNITYTSLDEPSIPLGDAVSANWESYSITASDMTINAEYTYSTLYIKGYRQLRTEDYKTTITFNAYVDKAVAYASIHWYISYDGVSFTDATPEGKSTYTVRTATRSFYVKAVYIRYGKIIGESETEQVVIKTDLFSRIKAFFRGIFSKLPIITQS